MPTQAFVPSTNQDLAQAQLPRVGEWLWTCRVGAETDLCEELASLRVSARALEPGLVASTKRPNVELTFARQGLPVMAVCPATCEAIARALRSKLDRPFALHVFAADSDSGNRLAALATALSQALTTHLQAQGARILPDGTAAHTEHGQILQVCLLSPELAACGGTAAATAPSLHPGGVLRMRRPRAAPSRSAQKLVEALAWLGHGPESSELCVDLGAAPGGWSLVLADRKCQVLAVDPGALAPVVARRVHHLRTNAFNFVPDESADWVFCDMAYRPLEVAALLARWGRHRWARFLVANIKLPMKKRVEMLGRVREILLTGGWTGLRIRQLYHDREEVTLFAWRGFGIDTRVPAAKSKSAAQPQTPRPKPSAPAKRTVKRAEPTKRSAPPAKRSAPAKRSTPAKRSGPTKRSSPAGKRSRPPARPQRRGAPR